MRTIMCWTSTKGLPDVPDGALIRFNREVCCVVGGMSVWRSKHVNDLLQEGCENNVYEPCLFSTFAKEYETGVHGDTIARDTFVGGVLLEVDDHLMGGPGLSHHVSMERLRGNFKFGKWHRSRQVHREEGQQGQPCGTYRSGETRNCHCENRDERLAGPPRCRGGQCRGRSRRDGEFISG